MISKYIEASILAFVQGFSEFIPVSSSAHLIIISKISNFSISSLQLDISLHLGSLLAIIFYFRKDLVNILRNKSLLLLIILGSFPLVVVGYFIYTSGLIENLRSLKVIAWTTLIFGILLFIADRSSIKNKIGTIKHHYSHFSINLTAYNCEHFSGKAVAYSSEKIEWIKASQIIQYPFPKATLKLFILAGLLND